MRRDGTTIERLERALIAGLAGYALAVQLVLAAVANGPALGHDLDAARLVCNTAGLVDAGGAADAAALCCVVQAVVAAPAPVPPDVRRVVAVLHLDPAADAPLPGAVVGVRAAQARAPPAA